jgi:hypothetical protein
MTACSNKNSVDTFLNNYEKVVVKWEQKSKDGKLTMTDLADINVEVLSFAEQEKELKDKSLKEMTPEQQTRLLKLVTRLTVVTTNISNN